jgi:hypothetical protein
MPTPLDAIHDDCSISSLHKYCSDCDLCRDRNIEANAIERTKAGIAEELLGYESATGIDSWLKVHQAAQIALNYEESPITNRQVESLQIVKCNSNVNVNVNVSNPDVTNIDVTGWGNGNEVPDVAPEGTATPISLPQIGTTTPIPLQSILDLIDESEVELIDADNGINDVLYANDFRDAVRGLVGNV